MAVGTYYGVKGRNAEVAFPPARVSAPYARGRVRQIVDYATFGAAGDIGSKIYIGRVPSAAVINPASTLYFEACGAGVTLDFGDVNDGNNLMAAVDVHAAGNSSMLAAVSAKNYPKKLWELLGYAADPDKMLDLFFTTGGAAVTGTPSLSWNLLFSVD